MGISRKEQYNSLKLRKNSLITQCKKLRIGKELFSKRVRFRFSKNTVNSPLKERTTSDERKNRISVFVMKQFTHNSHLSFKSFLMLLMKMNIHEHHDLK